MNKHHQPILVAMKYHYHAILINNKAHIIEGNSGQGYVQTTAQHHVHHAIKENRNAQKLKSTKPKASFKHGDDKTKHSFQYKTSWNEIRAKEHMCMKLKSQIS
jgi:hypothetical protein